MYPSNQRAFFSLKWKAALLFGILLILFNVSFPLLVYWNLEQKFAFSRQQIQRQFQQQLQGQLKTGSDELQRLADFLLEPAIKQKNVVTEVLNLLSKYQSELELNWNVTQAHILDINGLKAGGWGSSIPQAVKRHLPEVIGTETAQTYINCHQGCRQYQLLPILSETATEYVLILGYDISNTLLAFRAQTGADVAVISSDPGMREIPQNKVENWDKHINALTSYNNNVQLIQQLSQFKSYADIDQHGLILRDRRFPVEFQFVRIANVDDILMVIIDNIAGQQEEILQITYRSIGIAIFGVLVIGGGLFFFLSAPLSRLSTVARALPLLAKQQYEVVRDLVRGKKHPAKMPDELDWLENATQTLSTQLEALEESVRDRTENLNQRTRELQHERDFIKNLIDNSQLMIITLDKTCSITTFNQFAEQLSGCKEQEVLHSSMQRFFSNRQWPDVWQKLSEIKQQRLAVSQMETEFIDKDGNIHIISWLHSSLETPSDDAVILSVGLDITDKKRSEEQLFWLANHDALTELYNRRKFNKEFEQLLNHATRYEYEGILLFLDLDQFKDINDSCGHKKGDQLLRQVSAVLRSIIRENDVLARIGGDEFAIILPETNLDEAIKISETISNKLALIDFSHDNIRYSISCSIGLIRFPMNNLTVDELVSNADLAMYQAKSDGKSTWHEFTFDDMTRAQLQQRLKWKQKIEEALQNDRFKLYFQPIMEIKSQTISHYEVLLRMLDENDTLQFPDSFIPVAEQTGLIHRIDHYVLQQGINQLAELDRQHMNVSFSLNLSGHAIIDPDLLPLLAEFLEGSGAQPEHLIFELTETAAVADIPQARELMQEMNQRGCRFSLDDFGTGFASFRYLRELPVDLVKIDGSFISHILENADDRLFVQALVTVAKGMGKKTVAEFVENEQTLDLLRELGVDYAQGYYIGKPEPELLPQHRLG